MIVHDSSSAVEASMSEQRFTFSHGLTTHKHPFNQCPACLSTKIVLTAGYATHV